METETNNIHKLYAGDVEIQFKPNNKSHRYKILSIKDYDKEELKKLNKTKTTGTSAPNKIDKSRQLISWAVNTCIITILKEIQQQEDLSVSKISECVLKNKNAHNRSSSQACSIGTIVHEFVELFIKNKINKTNINDKDIVKFLKIKYKSEFDNWDDVKERLKKSCEAFLDWDAKFKTVYKNTERVCYSIKNNHLGIYDVDFELLEEVVGKEKAGLYLGDFKTSNGIYISAHAQLASYVKAREEEEEYIGNNFKYKGGVIIQFQKENVIDKKTKEIIKHAGSYEMKFRSRKDLIKDYKVYKACQVIEHAEKEFNRK